MMIVQYGGGCIDDGSDNVNGIIEIKLLALKFKEFPSGGLYLQDILVSSSSQPNPK